LQSPSFAVVHPGGQQPSAPPQAVIGVDTHSTSHVAALPVCTSAVQGLPSAHDTGHLDGGSHVSPGSIFPLPHLVAQSASLAVVHPAGQHPSAPPQAVIGVNTHSTSHVAALPVRASVVHAFPSTHRLGHVDGGSHVSPGS
jgi:hypothetical protein